VAIGYGVVLWYNHETFLTVIKTLGLFSVLLVAVCAVFTIRQSRADATR